MSGLVINLGNPREAAPTPTVLHAWLVENTGGLSLVMQADGDAADQRVIDLKIIDGKAVVISRNLFARRLCNAFGIEMKASVPICAEEPA